MAPPAALGSGRLTHPLGIAVACLLLSFAPPARGDPPAEPMPAVSFRPAVEEIEVYDFVEITARVVKPGQINSFTQLTVRGKFQGEGDEPVSVDGFCDAADGTLFKIRYMPSRPGHY